MWIFPHTFPGPIPPISCLLHSLFLPLTQIMAVGVWGALDVGATVASSIRYANWLGSPIGVSWCQTVRTHNLENLSVRNVLTLPKLLGLVH